MTDKTSDFEFSSEMMKVIFERSPDLMYILDVQGTLIAVNKTAETFSGFKAQEVIGKRITDIGVVIKSENSQIIEDIAKIVLGQTIGPQDYNMVKKDGTVATISVSAFPVTINGSRYLLGIARDVSEQKKMQQELTESERQYKLTLDNLPLMITVLDRDLKILTINKKQTEWGKTVGIPTDVVGKSILDLIPPEVASRERKILESVFETGKTAKDRFSQQYVNEPHTFDLEFTPIADDTGQTKQVIAIFNDITRNLDAEKTIRQLDEAVQLSGDAIFLTDTQGIIQYVNKTFTALYGYEKEEVIGKVTPRILKSNLLPQSFYEQFWGRLMNKEQVKLEITNKSKNGKIINLEVNVNPVVDPNGILTGFLAIQRDITMKKITEQEIIDNNERYRTFLQKLQGIAYEAKPKSLPLFFLGAVELITGYTEKDILSGNPSWEDLIVLEDKKRLFNKDALSMSTEEEYQITRKDTTLRWVHEYRHVSLDENGQVISYSGIIYDITDRKQMETLLKSRIDELEQFQRLTVGREIKMLELKKQVETLENELHKIRGEMNETVMTSSPAVTAKPDSDQSAVAEVTVKETK